MPYHRAVRTRSVATLGLGAVTLSLGGAFYRSPSSSNVVAAGGRLQRNIRLARLGARGGSRYAVTRARKVFADAERRVELDSDFQLKTAQDVTTELGNMKGAMMKLGQMASYVDTGLPDSVRQTLSSLQSDAPPMSAELAAEMIERELGQTPDRLFQEWDPVPIASASIGQVHRAITLDDRAVAVKVQYPGVAEAVASDLQNADMIFGALAGMFPGLEAGPVVQELKDRLAEELDYINEAKNQRYFAEFFDRHPFIHVPHVVDHLSTAKILTTDLATGSTFDEVMDWSQEEKNLTGETIFRFSFGSIYRLHAFNGDPHPGNYLFEKGGRVTFLDFGLVKRFSTSETQLFHDLIQAMVIERDGSRFRQVVEGANLLAVDAPFTDAEVEKYFSFYYRYVLEDRPVTIDQAYASSGVSHIFDANGPQGELLKQLNVPPSFVILQRITLGLMGILAQLEATRNWRAIAEELWPFIAGPPSTPTGVAIEEWRQARGQSRLGL
ncbi:MAG: putative unusual protein kinase regulating ubiquinone biosynthesis (AarF/ABC1/UbiB family) [Acidimicrobiales bacterium]